MLRQFSMRRILGSFLLDWLGTLIALTLAALLRGRLGNFPIWFLDRLGSLGITIGGTAGLVGAGSIPALPIYFSVAVLWPFFLVMFSVYDGRRNETMKAELLNVFIAVCIACVALAGFLFMTYREFSRGAFFIFLITDIVFLLGGRSVFHLYRTVFSTRVSSQKRVGIIVGAGPVGRNAAGELKKYAWTNIVLVGFLDDDREKQGGEIEGLPVLGTLDEAAAIVTKYHVQDAVIALPMRAHERLMTICNTLQKQMVHVHVIPDLFALSFPNATLDGFGGIPVIDLGLPGIQGWKRVVKRAFDVIAVSIGLVVISPFLALIALIIKLDSDGPVIYRQIRIGENGRPFTMFKFRSMRIGSDPGIHQQYIEQLIKRNITAVELAKETGQKSLKMENDPRVTRFGTFIRKTSIDELPQLFNVLRGDMSLVGPRPSLPYEVELYQEWHKRRFEALPGITGLWQVRGRNRVSFDEMVRMDLEYIERQSLPMDVFILLQTPWVLLSTEGAG